MTPRFVLDESSWTAAAGADIGVLSNAIEHLLERLDVARERNEGVVRHADYYETDLGDGVKLYSALFETGCRVQLDRDVTERLALALDRVNEFDDSRIVDYDAEFEGTVWFAPGAVWAHACCLGLRHMAVLPLPLGKAHHGQVPVTVAGITTEIFFVTEESQHVGFFRAVVGIENADEEEFERLARSAFPTLEWADDVWHGLGHLSRPYIEVRAQLVRHLGSLSNHGAACFHKHITGYPRNLQRVLSATIGSETSDENGHTKRNISCRRDRTRSHQGTNKVFWWHVKLQPHIDRIHFLYEPASANSALPEHGHIVVGLFKDHCLLPN